MANKYPSSLTCNVCLRSVLLERAIIMKQAFKDFLAVAHFMVVFTPLFAAGIFIIYTAFLFIMNANTAALFGTVISSVWVFLAVRWFEKHAK